MPLAIEAPAVVIAAIFAVLFMLAWSRWGQIIVATITVNLPVVGNVIGDLVAEGLEATYAALQGLLDQYVRPIVNLLISPIAAVENAFEVVRLGLDAYAAQLGQLATVGLPSTLQLAEALGSTAAGQVLQYAEIYAAQQADQVRVGAQLALQGDFTYVQGEIHDIQSQVAGIIATTITAGLTATEVTALATSAAQAVLAAAQHVIDQEIQVAYQDAAGLANSLFATAEADIASAFAQAEAYARTALSQVAGLSATDIDNLIATGIAAIATDVDTAVAAAIGVIGTDLPDIAAALKAIPAAIPLDLAGVAALAGATTWALTRYLEECGIPNCRNLSKYGSDLQSLLALGSDAAFISLIVGLVENPSSALDTIESEFGSIINGAAGAAKALFS